MATEYSEKLKDPRWQRKRLEILGRDNFACISCHANDKTLVVHHLFYKKNRLPWEYDNKNLITLCEDCHKDEHDNRKSMETLVISSLRDKMFTNIDVFNIFMGIEEMKMVDTPQVISAAIAYGLTDENIMKIIVSHYLTAKELETQSQLNRVAHGR